MARYRNELVLQGYNGLATAIIVNAIKDYIYLQKCVLKLKQNKKVTAGMQNQLRMMGIRSQEEHYGKVKPLDWQEQIEVCESEIARIELFFRGEWFEFLTVEEIDPEVLIKRLRSKAKYGSFKYGEGLFESNQIFAE